MPSNRIFCPNQPDILPPLDILPPPDILMPANRTSKYSVPTKYRAGADYPVGQHENILRWRQNIGRQNIGGRHPNIRCRQNIGWMRTCMCGESTSMPSHMSNQNVPAELRVDQNLEVIRSGLRRSGLRLRRGLLGRCDGCFASVRLSRADVLLASLVDRERVLRLPPRVCAR